MRFRAGRARRRLAALMLLCGFAMPLPAQTRPQPAGTPLVYVLVVDDRGEWRADRQERFVLPPDESRPGGLSTDWKALTATRPFRLQAYDQRLLLLRYPERLLSSSWANSYFSARHVLVLRPLDRDRVEGRLFDLETGRDRALVLGESVGGGPRAQVLSQSLEQAGIAAEPVLAHPEGLYHRASASHLSARAHYEPVESASRAELYGFAACGLCYPRSSRDSLYDDLDRGLGDMVAAQVESTYALSAEGAELERVRRVGQRLLQRNRFPDQGYRFELLDSPTVNAYAAPTGPIYVTRGLLDGLRSDDELAAVLGHELSHSERRHGRQQYLASRQTGVVGLLVTVATGVPLASLGTNLIATIMGRGYSRGFELEADRDGMMAAYAAGYDPAAYLRVQELLEAESQRRGGGGLAWLRTHPGGRERKEQLSEILERSLPVRQRLDELEGWDWGLAVYLKGQTLSLVEQQDELFTDLDRYQRFAATAEGHPRVSRYAGDVPPEVWREIKALLEPPVPPAAEPAPVQDGQEEEASGREVEIPPDAEPLP